MLAVRFEVSRGPDVTEGNGGPGPVLGLRSGLPHWFAA